jgi:two-component system nitrate/nitrite response regulator NarL
MKSETKIKVLLVDDHPFVLEGVKSWLRKHNQFEVVGEAASGKEAIQKTQELRPDVVVMDISMPIMNGLEAAPRLRETSPNAKVLMLTVHDGREFIGQIVQSGASGYVRKNGSPAELIRGIESVHRGEAFFPADVTQTFFVDYLRSQGRSIEARPRGISEREREVLGLVVEGLSTKEIADRLHMSVRTAQKHRENIMRALGVHKATELVKVAMSRRLVNFAF